MAHSVPILLYHRIDHSSLPTATPPEVFRRHLEWLSNRGWRSLSANEFTFFLRSGRPLPAKSFMITFDDGYASLAGVAYSMLKEFQYKAIGFLSTKLLCDAEEARQPGSGKEPQAFLSWQQVRALQASGVIDFHSHTHTHSHDHYLHCGPDEVVEDLATSVDILAHELILPRRHFIHLAWPAGKPAEEWRTAARHAGFAYQYDVSRRAFRLDMRDDEIPRTCFDAASVARFQCEIQLQSGLLSPVWRAAYPTGKKLRALPARDYAIRY